MKVLWIIKRKVGSTSKFVTDETVAPTPGDGAIVDGIPVAVGPTLSTPMAGELDKHDIAVEAKEQ